MDINDEYQKARTWIEQVVLQSKKHKVVSFDPKILLNRLALINKLLDAQLIAKHPGLIKQALNKAVAFKHAAIERKNTHSRADNHCSSAKEVHDCETQFWKAVHEMTTIVPVLPKKKKHVKKAE